MYTAICNHHWSLSYLELILIFYHMTHPHPHLASRLYSCLWITIPIKLEELHE